MFIGIFLVSGLSYHIYQSQSEEQLVAVVARDEVKELMLPDGTKVWLNKHTTLKYPREFSEKERNVYMEGEGYFEVKRNVEKPFIVRSEAMQVRVLGTVFNLKSDKMNRSAVATLIKGEIEVKGNHNEGMIVLASGQKAELNAVTRRLVVKQVDTGIENWHNNQFVFENADIFTIARTLENSYGCLLYTSFWTGEGECQSALGVQWISGDNWEDPIQDNVHFLSWGYRWKESDQSTGYQMILAIAKADPRFFVVMGPGFGGDDSRSVRGLGYDANGDGCFSIKNESMSITYDAKDFTDGVI